MATRRSRKHWAKVCDDDNSDDDEDDDVKMMRKNCQTTLSVYKNSVHTQCPI